MAEGTGMAMDPLIKENAELRAQLAEAQEVLRAIRAGEVDALVVSGPEGERVFTLQGAEAAYRTLVETINEGAATLAADGAVLYCNRRLAEMVELPHEQIVGSPVANLLASGEVFQALIGQALAGKPVRGETELQATGGRRIPVYLSLCRLPQEETTAVCMVVTDLTEQKRREELLAAGALAHSVLESTADAIAVCDENGEIIIANRALKALCASSPLLQPFDRVLPLTAAAGESEEEPFSVREALRAGDFRSREVCLRRDDGKRSWLLLNAARLSGAVRLSGFVVGLTDITESRRLNRTLQALSRGNQALLQAREESALLQEVCRIIAEDCGHAMVWIGYAEDGPEKRVRPVAHAGCEEGYLETLQITWADDERGRGPTGAAIRTGRASSCRSMLTDPAFALWRPEALRRGYASFLVLPLKQDGRPFGAVTIYSREPDAFAEEEVKLLEELAGNLAYGIGALRSRAAQEQAEETLRESEARFRLALSNAPVSVAVQDRDLRYIWAYNQHTAPPGDIVGKLDAEIFTPEEARHIAEIKQRILREGVELREQMWLERPSGRVFIDASFVPIRDAAGQIAGVGCATVDLTPTKLAEEALRESEERLRLVVGAVKDYAIFMLDPEGKVTTWNNGAQRLKGYTPEQILGQHFSCFYTAEDLAAAKPERALAEALARGEHVEEGWRVRRNGSRFLAQVSISPIYDTGGELRGFAKVIQDISERKRVEAELAQHRHHLEELVRERTAELQQANAYNRSLLEASIDPLVTIGPDGKITDVNQATEAATGRPREALLGTDFCDYFTEPDRARDGYRQVFSEGLVRDYPLELRHRDGSLTSVLYNASVYRDESGAVAGVFAAARDITKRRRAEAALQAERQRFLGVLETLPVIVALLHPDHRVEWVNRAYRDALGDNAGRLCHESQFGLGQPSPECQAFLPLQTGQPHHWEWALPNGRIYDVYNFPFADASGLPLILEMDIDVTETRKAQAALRELNESLERRVIERTNSLQEITQRLQAVMEAVPVGISFSDDATCQRVTGNRAVLAQFGVAPTDNLSASAPGADALGRQLRFFRQGRLLSDAELPLQRAVAENRQIPPIELEVELPDGRRWFCEASGAPVRDAEGKAVAGLAVTVDITQRKQAEEALLRSEKLASVGRMAASIAHEINNPLAAVMNTIFLARTSEELPQTVREYLDLADEELRRIAHITQQTLGFYRESVTPAALSVNAVLNSAVDLLRGKIKLKRARIEKQYRANLDVVGVPGELRQVFANLLANSLDAIGEQGTVTLRVSRARCGGPGQLGVRVTVADSGTGIDAATLPRIFEPLFTTKETTGSGLGLWVSKQLVEKHRGSIRVRSRTRPERQGTTFSVVIPLAPGRPGEDSRAAAQRRREE